MQVYSEEIRLALPLSTGRSEGVHLSGIIRCLAIENDLLSPDTLEELSLVDARTIVDPAAVLRISIGLAWEQWYIRQLQGVTDHPGELYLDGIYMTPDGECVDQVWRDVRRIWVPGQPRLGLWPRPPRNQALWGWQQICYELKSTYKSMNTVGFTGQVFKKGKYPFHPMDTQHLWTWQTKGYCKALGTLLTIIDVLFLCGDYSYPIRPKLLRYYVEYEQAELDTSWQLFRDYKDYQLQLEGGV